MVGLALGRCPAGLTFTRMGVTGHGGPLDVLALAVVSAEVDQSESHRRC